MVEGLGKDKAGLLGDALALRSRERPQPMDDSATPMAQTLEAINQGPETEASQQFALHAFASAGQSAYRRPVFTGKGGGAVVPSPAAAPMATAVARLMHPGDKQAQDAEAKRLTAIMTSPAGPKLFAPDLHGNEQASLQLRMQVFNALKAHPEITAESLTSKSSPWMEPRLAQVPAEGTRKPCLAACASCRPARR
jgi:hypothetical protein